MRYTLAFCVRTPVAHELLYGFELMPGTRAEAMTLRLLELLPACRSAAPKPGGPRHCVVLARSGNPIGP
jgi:hypothetical protein